MDTVFNSRDRAFRNPVGAVEEGTSIHFKITLPRGMQCSAAYLSIRQDSTKQDTVFSMFWCGLNGYDREFWECDYAPAQSGLFWYHFELDTASGRKNIFCSSGGEGIFGGQNPWQLTVYEKNFQTPDWLTGGVMYQIFPDRFFSSGITKENVPADRTMRKDWGGMPQWRPNEQGEITNSDYFGGDLQGIAQKLPYLKSLGVTCLYLNPIFEAHSNHRYNTADYSKIDPLLGTQQDFEILCEQAKKLGIHIMLDGVFSHTGSDSIYFNRQQRYPGAGAYNSVTSPYYSWYHFTEWPDRYRSWWGFQTLPEVEKSDAQYDRYINGEDGIVRRWIHAGACGWRLDVADELPDCFLDHLRAAAKAENPDTLILGEVWEDASHKESYGTRRRYLLGKQLDSVMNYPFRNAILGYLTGQDAPEALEMILSVVENYPPQVLRIMMNHIGTHDTERALTALAGKPVLGQDREWQANEKLTSAQWQRGIRLMHLASAMQYTLPGVPCIYYGDEAGMEGYRDPFNRGCYPWGGEDAALVEWYQKLGQLRLSCSALKEGSLRPLQAKGRVLSYIRDSADTCPAGALLCAFNAGTQTEHVRLPFGWDSFQVVLGGTVLGNDIVLEPESCCLLVKN